jgi:hypothetical protein
MPSIPDDEARPKDIVLAVCANCGDSIGWSTILNQWIHYNNNGKVRCIGDTTPSRASLSAEPPAR